LGVKSIKDSNKNLFTNFSAILRLRASVATLCTPHLKNLYNFVQKFRDIERRFSQTVRKSACSVIAFALFAKAYLEQLNSGCPLFREICSRLSARNIRGKLII